MPACSSWRSSTRELLDGAGRPRERHRARGARPRGRSRRARRRWWCRSVSRASSSSSAAVPVRWMTTSRRFSWWQSLACSSARWRWPRLRRSAGSRNVAQRDRHLLRSVAAVAGEHDEVDLEVRRRAARSPQQRQSSTTPARSRPVRVSVWPRSASAAGPRPLLKRHQGALPRRAGVRPGPSQERHENVGTPSTSRRPEVVVLAGGRGSRRRSGPLGAAGRMLRASSASISVAVMGSPAVVRLK